LYYFSLNRLLNIYNLSSSLIIAAPSRKGKKEYTKVFYGGETAINLVLHFLSETNETIDACVDNTRPSLAIDILVLRKAFVDAKKRGVKLRYVTEITKDNIRYCKRLLTMVDELRHLNGIKGNFYISETAYLAPASYHEEGKPAAQVIYSNVEEIVDHQNYIFDTLWSRAISAKERIREIEEGILPIRTKLLKNQDEIIKEIKRKNNAGNKLSICTSFGGMQMSYNYMFDSYKKVVDKYKKGESKEGMRWLMNIDRKSIKLVKLFLKSGIQIRHIKHMPPISFGVTDKEVAITIEKMKGGKMSQSYLISNEPLYVSHFNSLFDELWKKGIDVNERIKTIKEGFESTRIEIIENPEESLALSYDLVKSAKNEVLRIFPSINAFRRQIRAGVMHLFKEILERGIKVRILLPADDVQIEQIMNEVMLAFPMLDIRSIDKSLQTSIGVLIVDRKESLIIESRDDTKDNYYAAVGLTTYSNSKRIALSYASIFDSLWKQGELYEQLKVHDRMQREFINIAAHELRTPIQPILGLSEIASSKIKNQDPELDKLLETIFRNAKRLSRLTEDILDVTKIESQSLKLHKQNCNLKDIIVNVFEDYNIKNRQQKNLNLLYHCNEDIIIEADKMRLTQVISNLLNNSIKFTKEGEISVNVERDDIAQLIIVSVRDTGLGIDPEILPRLFTKFASRSFEGTGLGLYISKSIIEAHGGRIWTENNDGNKGATFSFSLPLNEPDASGN
jgi:two-component system, OmpR family, sensor histidine kinase VicK